MREVDVAHQAEDEREAARDEEVEAAEGDAVEERVKEDFLAPDRLHQPRRPGREYEPQQHRDRYQDRERPEGMALEESPHALKYSPPCP